MLKIFAYDTDKNNKDSYFVLKELIEQFADGDNANLLVKNLEVISEDIIRAKTFCHLMNKYANSYVECIDTVEANKDLDKKIQDICNRNDFVKIYHDLDIEAKKIIHCKTEFDYLWFTASKDEAIDQ